MHTLLINNLPYVYAVSEESDDTENLLSEIQELKEELRKAQEKLKNVDKRDGLHISQSKRKREDDDDADGAGPSASNKKHDGNQSDKVRQKEAVTHKLTSIIAMNKHKLPCWNRQRLGKRLVQIQHQR